MERNWWRIITPCTCGIALSFLIGIGGAVAGGYGLLGAIVFFPVGAILLMVTVLVRMVLNSQPTTTLWIVELIIMIIAVIIVSNYWGG